MFKKLWRMLLDKIWPPSIWKETESPRLRPASTSYISPLPVAPPEVASFSGYRGTHVVPLPAMQIQVPTVSAVSCSNPVVLLTDTSPSPVEIVKAPRKRKSPPKKIKAKTLEKRPKSP